MPYCDECNVFVSRRIRLDSKRSDPELDYEQLVCKSCYLECNGNNKSEKCKKVKKNLDLTDLQIERRNKEKTKKLNQLAASTKNPKYFPKVPNTKLR